MTDKAQEILETEFGGRHPESVLLRGSIFWLGAAWSAFQLWATWAGTLNTQKLGAIHLAFGMALVFLAFPTKHGPRNRVPRSEEHTSELQSLMRISYAVFCLKKKTKQSMTQTHK